MDVRRHDDINDELLSPGTNALLTGESVVMKVSPPPDTSTKSRRIQQIVVVGMFVAFFIAILVPFLILQKHKADESFGGYEVLASYDAPREPKPNLLLLLSGMNTKTYDVSVATTLINPPAQVVSPTNPAEVITPFRIQVGSNAIAINANTSNLYAPLDSKLPLQKGSMAWYPFDMYEVRMFVLVNTSMSPFNGQPQDPVDVSFVIVTPSNFDWNYRIKETYGDTAVAVPGVYSITVEIKRQFNVYTALVFAGIWAVTVSIGYIGSCAVIWKRRAADNPVIYISALFAVPGFRNTLPGSPPYGCIFDILCTYFAIAVVLSFLVLVSVAYMKKAA